MKYRLLTKEQLEGLHQEFAIFLASQSIDVNEWNEIKTQKPEVVLEEMAIFSDIVWEDVLTKTKYLEHFSESSVNFFKCDEHQIHRIAINITQEINLLTQQGLDWLMHNSLDNSVEIFKGNKSYSSERNLEIFDLIEKGSIISNGKLYNYFSQLIN